MKTPEDLTETDATEQTPLATELGKSLAISAASTVGTLAGMALYGAIAQKLRDRKVRKQEQKVNPTETTEE